jgi:two-component system, NarL family, response regulator YdfI
LPNIRILIADDHMVVREGLRTILSVEDDFEIVGEASDGRAAVEQAALLEPDLVLMDLRMPGMDGIEAIKQIKARRAGAIVILTTYDDDDLIVKGLRAGAQGYLLKDASRRELFEAIRAAARGEALLPPGIAAKVVAHLADPARTDGLSERERQVLELLAEGAANKEIAARLNITERTVKAHVTNILDKLGVNSRIEAVAHAMRAGLVKLGE